MPKSENNFVNTDQLPKIKIARRIFEATNNSISIQSYSSERKKNRRKKDTKYQQHCKKHCEIKLKLADFVIKMLYSQPNNATTEEK